MIVRNDDVAYDTSLAHLEQFSAVCDHAGMKIIQAITLCGPCIPIDRSMENSEIQAMSRGLQFSDRPDLIEFLRKRNDLIAVHGLYHTHEPSLPEIQTASAILTSLGLRATYFVPPFNEGTYPANLHGFTVSAGEAFKIETAIAKGRPATGVKVGYLHSWRFDPECSRKYVHPSMGRQFTLDDFERWLSHA